MKRLVTLLYNWIHDNAVKPANVTLTGLDTAVTEGTAVVVYCVAEGARPAATITWYNDSSPLQKSAVETTQLQVSASNILSRHIFRVYIHPYYAMYISYICFFSKIVKSSNSYNLYKGEGKGGKLVGRDVSQEKI